MSKKCPACGAVSKVEALENRCPACSGPYRAEAPDDVGFAPAAASLAVASPTPPPAKRVQAFNRQPFLTTLRLESNYPTFRTVVNIGYWFAVLLAVITLITTLIASSAAPTFVSGLGILGAFVIAVLGKAGKEAAIMLADMSDATVHMAQKQEAARSAP